MALFSTGTNSDKLAAGTTAERPVLALTDAGSIRFNTDLGQMEQWDGTAWGPIGGSVTTSGTAPANPNEGELWYNTNDSRLYAAVDDAGGTPVWVDASPDSQNVYWDRDTVNGILSPLTTADGLSVNGASVFNEDGTDVDFRVEGDTDTDLLFVDAGSDVVAVSADATEVAALVANNADVKLYVNGDATMTSQNDGPLAGFRNQIINGDFRVWQRSTNTTQQISSTVSTYISADRFAFFNQSGTQNVRVARNGNPIAEAPAAYSLQIDSATVSLQEVRMIQGIELDNAGQACQFTNGSTWTASVYSDQDLTGITPAFGFAADTIRSNNVSVTGVESWQSLGGNRYKSTFTINVDPVSTSAIFYYLDAPPAGVTTVNYACLQLEPGPVATPFEHRPIAAEVALCYRYFYRFFDTSGPGGFFSIQQTSFYDIGTASYGGQSYTYDFPVVMRATPSMNPAAAVNNIGGDTTIVALDTRLTNHKAIITPFATTGGGSRALYSLSGDHSFDAEL